jgi:hypothetical protein
MCSIRDRRSAGARDTKTGRASPPAGCRFGSRSLAAGVRRFVSHAWLRSFRVLRPPEPNRLSISEARPARPPRALAPGPAPAVELGRFELPTSRVQGGRSPTKLQPRGAPRSLRAPGWACLESNQGPQSYQDCALTD